jgi:O-antigen ligase
VSAAPTRRPISQALLALALICSVAVLSFRSGGFHDQPRTTFAILAWVLLAGVLLAAPSSLWPPTRAGRIAVAGMLALAAWTAISVSWAPLRESAREDAVRLALYAAVLPLAVAAFRERELVRSLELALAVLALAVVGYGLLGELGVLDLADSPAAAGRLAQPLTYWNAMAAMAALGIVLTARIAVDRTRPAPARRLAAVALAPLVVGLYVTYSRGGIAVAAVGLLCVALLAPEASRIWERFGTHRRGAVAAIAALSVVAAIAVVVTHRESTPARGATAERLADVGSTRGDYWRVALDSFASDPLTGTGTGGFRVEWPREREVAEGAVDAHSLYLETAAELGIVGLLLLAALVLGVAACARSAFLRDPTLLTGPIAALVLLAVHCAVDWDWEMPALALPMLLLAGVAIAQASPHDRPRARG